MPLPLARLLAGKRTLFDPPPEEVGGKDPTGTSAESGARVGSSSSSRNSSNSREVNASKVHKNTVDGEEKGSLGINQKESAKRGSGEIKDGSNGGEVSPVLRPGWLYLVQFLRVAFPLLIAWLVVKYQKKQLGGRE